MVCLICGERVGYDEKEYGYTLDYSGFVHFKCVCDTLIENPQDIDALNMYEYFDLENWDGDVDDSPCW